MIRSYEIPYSEIKIVSQVEAERIVDRKPGYWNVISIWSGGGGKHGTKKPDLAGAKNVCKMRFHDVEKEGINPRNGEPFILCQEKHIKDALVFAREKRNEPLLLHCHAGISRSSAICYIILLDYLRENYSENIAEDAMILLTRIKNWNLIYPNRYIINLGMDVLGKEMGDKGLVFKWARELSSSPVYQKIYS